jgi:hypothetical protein
MALHLTMQRRSEGRSSDTEGDECVIYIERARGEEREESVKKVSCYFT